MVKNDKVINNETPKIFTNDQLIVTNDEAMRLAPLDISDLNKPFKKDEEQPFKEGYAYIEGDYFYPYRGFTKERKEPGVYATIDKSIKGGNDNIIYSIHRVFNAPSYMEPEYRVLTHLVNTSTDEIIQVLRSKDDLYVVLPDSTRYFTPTITESDDILKRAIKEALLRKNIDIDQYKSRFIDKNALFNFKQVIKGSSKLSMMLFERGCSALNLKYRIIVEELDPEIQIGERLDGSIIVSSEDTFTM